jgi:hypothetical protein
MLHGEADKGVELGDGLTRRHFLRLGAGVGVLSLTDLAALGANRSWERQCILLFLVGGPSHLDTWDLKPDASAEVRGPFRPIETSVPGIRLSEHFPRMAAMAERFALVRSLHHSAAPIHETGQQLVQTGRLFCAGQEAPHYGATLSALRGPGPGGLPASVVLPTPITRTGVTVSHGQGAGCLGPRHEPFVLHADPIGDSSSGPDWQSGLRDAFPNSGQARQAFALNQEKPGVRDRYGRDTFGQSCLLARRLVEHGVGLVTVNMFDTVFNEVTWDCHADGGSLATTLDDYRDTLCPQFDRAYSALLEDLCQRGRLDSTLVLAVGEFGRTPYLNPRGGRDHWPGCWTALLAGGGVRGGQVVGASDALGAEPADRPVTPADLAATVYCALGLDPRTRLPGQDLPLADGNVVGELFR